MIESCSDQFLSVESKCKRCGCRVVLRIEFIGAQMMGPLMNLLLLSAACNQCADKMKNEYPPSLNFAGTWP